MIFLFIVPFLALYSALAQDSQNKNATEEEDDTAYCAKDFGYAENATVSERSSHNEIGFCEQHKLASCCGKNETQRIFQRWASSSVMKVEKCGSITKQALCSYCDADVGQGLKSDTSEGIIYLCPDFCNLWYSHCKDEYWVFIGGQLVPCGNAAVCSTLELILGHLPEEERAEKFCHQAFYAESPHFEMAKPPGIKDDECFDGVPAAIGRIPKRRTRTEQKYTRKSNPGRDIGYFEQMWINMKYNFRRIGNFYGKKIHDIFGDYLPMVLLALSVILVTLILVTE